MQATFQRRSTDSDVNGVQKLVEIIAKELVEDPKEDKNWKSIFIALLVIAVILGSVITTIVIVSPGYKEEVPPKRLSFEDVYQDKYKPRKIDPVWQTGGNDVFIYRNNIGELISVNCTSNETSVFLSKSAFRELNADTFIVSSAGDYILFLYNIRKRELNTDTFTVSPAGDYILFLYNIRKKFTFSRVFYAKVLNVQTRLFTDLYGPFGYDIQYVTWLPDRNTVIFVQENNIYSRAVDSEIIHVISKSGVIDVIYNGVPDWLYEERIFQSDNTIWPSSAGSYLVYAEIDDSQVTKYSDIFYGDQLEPYTTVTTQSYPKAGTRNPIIKLKLIDLLANRTHSLPPPSDFKNTDHYVTHVQWLTTDTVLVKWLNRPQNKSVITICNATEASCRENFRYPVESWRIHKHEHDIISTGKDEYFIILPQRHGSAGSYQQIASIDSKAPVSDGITTFLTNGKTEVVKLLRYDKENNSLFYLAVPENNTKARHLYSIKVSRDKLSTNQPTCLTCEIEDCDYFDATFSGSGKYYVLVCLGPSLPFYAIYKAPVTFVRMLENNDDLQRHLRDEMLPKTRYMNIPVPDSEEEIHAKLLLPPVYKEADLLKYNMLVVVGPEPGSKLVTQRFNIGWEHVMSSVHSIIVAFIDVRVSGGRDLRGQYRIHSNIRKSALDDLFTAVGFLKRLPFVHELAGIYGREFGGYLVSSVLTEDQSLVSCGLAVSPIIDWSYMDTFYAERYMGVPGQGKASQDYSDACILKHINKLMGKSLMIMHGMGDKRVHFQNAVQLMKSLLKAGLPFQSQIYPDTDNLFSVNSIKSHVFYSMETYILQCFGLPRGTEYHVVEEEEEE